MARQSFSNAGSWWLVKNLVTTIQDNKGYLSDVDGLIGDGDHGINMNKGFTMAGEQLTDDMSFDVAIKLLGDTLLNEIGGSMGPIYGTFFRKMAKCCRGKSTIDAALFSQMLHSALEGIMDIGGAQEGDKTLVDCLSPAVRAFDSSLADVNDFCTALLYASEAAEKGKNATKDMMAKVGRASRLGERSIGVLDAGSVSCCLILKSLFTSIIKDLSE